MRIDFFLEEGVCQWHMTDEKRNIDHKDIQIVQVIFLMITKFHWRERKNKIQNFGNVQNFGFSFFSRSPQTYSPKQESIRSAICLRSRFCPMKTILIIRSP